MRLKHAEPETVQMHQMHMFVFAIYILIEEAP